MGNLIFLVGAVVLSVVGSVWLWLRNRPPSSVMSSIDGFRQEMSALAGERPPASPRPTPGRGAPRSQRPSSRSARPGNPTVDDAGYDLEPGDDVDLAGGPER